MKKFLAVIICVITIFTAFLSGCSCAPTSNPLEFNNLAIAVHESQKLDQNTVEKHIYSVKLNTDYSAQMKLDEYFNNAPVTINSENFNGSYQVEYSFTPYTSESIKNEQNEILKNSSVLNSLLKSKTVNVYTYKTELSLNVDYDFGETDVSGSKNQDTIKTTTYFVGQENAFIPIYSFIENRCNHLAYQNSELGILNVYYDSEIIYSNGTYTSKTIYYNKDKQPNGKQTTYKTEYEKGKVYDASQLLFTIRNVVVPNKSYQILPFASPAYNKPTEIRFDHKGQTVYASGFDLTVNAFGENYTKNTGKDVSVNKISYYVNEVRKTGVSQELFIQRADAGEVKNRGYLVKYVAPMMTYGANSLMLGALEYNLTSVEIFNK